MRRSAEVSSLSGEGSYTAREDGTPSKGVRRTTTRMRVCLVMARDQHGSIHRIYRYHEINLLLAYLAKWIWIRSQALTEFHHPVQCCYIGLIPVSTMLIAAVAPYSNAAAWALFTIFVRILWLLVRGRLLPAKLPVIAAAS